MPVSGQKTDNRAFEAELKAANISDTTSGASAITSASGSQDATAASPKDEDSGNAFFSFLGGLLDIINPLQHLPVISTIYRHLTGDEISPVARIAGDALYGGAVGAAFGVVNVVAEQQTGKDIGDNVLAMMSPDDAPVAPDTAIMTAQNIPAQNATTQNIRANDIIWDTPASSDTGIPASEFLLARATPTTPHRTGPAGLTPERVSYPNPAIHEKEVNTTSNRTTAARISADEEFGAPPQVDSLTLLQSQEAPVDMAGTAVPPELIAYKMMDALDKYAAMKKTSL